jgi:hypothetical protein
MKTEQGRLFWRFLGCVALIVATVSVANFVAGWTRLAQYLR